MDIRNELRNFIEQNLEVDDVSFTDDDNYFEQRFVNSLFAMRLVNFVEDKLDIEVDGDDLALDNFATINRVMSLISRLKP